MTHTPTPWFKNNRFWCGPRFDTDDQSDGMVDDILEVYGENKEIDIDFVLRAVNAHDALVKALDWAMARIVKKAPHQAIEGDSELYSFAEAHSLLAKLKNAEPASRVTSAERGTAA